MKFYCEIHGIREVDINLLGSYEGALEVIDGLECSLCRESAKRAFLVQRGQARELQAYLAECPYCGGPTPCLGHN